jgi:hypothetical protein
MVAVRYMVDDVTGGVRHILSADLAGNVIELFQPR